MLTFTDIFCGAGGSSIGLAAAGYELKLAANHWDRAIETHAANFRDAEHLCADVNNYDMRRLPRTDILWASPICTEISPAGGRRRKRRAPGQGDLLEEAGYVSPSAFDRTRATAFDVIRATEVHRYTAVLIENVIEFAVDWELFDWWLQGMVKLGYNHQVVCVSSAHVGGDGNPYAPQWRDRLYIVFTRVGVPLPDVQPHPWAWCVGCDRDIRADQWWKNPRGPRIGKYRTQYVYGCPVEGHGAVEPYVLPAASAIDWSDLGQRIGDRSRPLAAATLRRIETGLRMFGRPAMVNANHEDDRLYPADGWPLPSRTARIGDGLACPPMLVPAGGVYANNDPTSALEPMRTRVTRDSEAIVTPPFLVDRYDYSGPDAGRVRGVDEPMTTVTAAGRTVRTLCVPEPFVTMLRENATARGMDEPLATVTTGRNHGLTVPPGAFYMKNYGGHAEARHMVKGVAEPLGVVTGQDHHALVIPYRRKSLPTTTGEPLHTMSTRDSAALLYPQVDVDDCHFRMLSPREHLRAQRFPDSYIVTGNKGEQTMQAGNAVSANVAQWLAGQVAAVLDGSPA